ncbi:MAG: HAD family phosphatase [Lachnospiraceae bacterium]|nr:HAD family phosphatase [Lachnospiraceae bacterium]
MKDFDAVVFDMDGVLLDSETPLIQAFEERAAARGLKADIAAICHRCLGVTRDISRRVWQAEFGEDFDYDAMRDEAYALFMEKTAAGVPMKPYVPEMLAWLKAAGKKVGLASSTPWAVVTKELKTDGLIDYFDALVCGDMVSRSKPDPAIYLEACRRLGVDPRRSAGIEDSFAGVRAVKAAGMLTIMVPDILQPDEATREAADYVAPSMAEVRRYLEE